MSSTSVEVLHVPNGRLHCEVRGSGPVLLLIPGAPVDAGSLAGVADRLSDRYTTVSYDLRGLSRSLVDDDSEDSTVEVLGDDAHRVLDHFSPGEPAAVLGCSGGALVALELMARHPKQVRAVVAHEPPAMGITPERAEWASFIGQIRTLHRQAGMGPAMNMFIGMVEGRVGPAADPSHGEVSPPPVADLSEMPPDAAESLGRMLGNLDHFLGSLLLTLGTYQPDIVTLRRHQDAITVGIGTESVGQPLHRLASLVAEEIGCGIADFPGAHQGFADHTIDFAETIHRVIRSRDVV